MSILGRGRRTVAVGAVGAVGLGLSLAASGGAAQASAGSALLYKYNFIKATGSIANSAPGGATAPMTLQGDWTNAPYGVHFAGDTSGKSSVGYAAPGGKTITQPASGSVGIGVRFQYQAPPSSGCYGDSLNITQVGRFQANVAQAKLQMTNCGDFRSGEYLQCRFAGSLTSTNIGPVTSTVKLVGGDTYVVTCQKEPDANGKATVVFSVTDLNAPGGATNVTQYFSVAALGSMDTSAAFSAGNKYPLPSASQNTDQFQGTITNTVLCAGATDDVTSCLTTNAGSL